MRAITCVVLFLLFKFSFAAKNVLILDHFASPSHQNWLHKFAHGLANHGYNVTSLSCKTISEPKPVNLHSYLLDGMYQSLDGFDVFQVAELSLWETVKLVADFESIFDDVLFNSSGYKAIMDYPKGFKFDLIIYDYLGSPSLLEVTNRFPDAKLIGASAVPTIDYTNSITMAPNFPSFVPNLYMDHMEDTFIDRLKSFLLYVAIDFVTVRNFPPTAIVLVNHSPVLDFVTPIMPGVIPVGGLQIETPKALPGDLEEIFATAQKGVALGTNVRSELIGKTRLRAIIDALAEFPDYHIVWKIDMTKVELKMPANVFVRSWLPQNDILADDRTKLFISHAGGLSTQEATWYGKPVLALPVMIDQFPNAERAVKSGMALKLDLKSIEKDTLKDTISELLQNQKYTEAAQLRSNNFRDQMESPLERALWWVDFVARNPDVSFLRSQTLEQMNYLVKYSIDVIALLTTLLLILLWTVVKTILWVLSIGGAKAKVKIN